MKKLIDVTPEDVNILIQEATEKGMSTKKLIEHIVRIHVKWRKEKQKKK